MRAVRFEGPDEGVVLSRSAPEPSPREGEAIVRPVRLGIGFADLEVSRGSLGPGPITLGHQFSGVVESIRPSRAQGTRYDALVGRRVVGSIHAVCGECALCRAGVPAHCRERTTLGIKGRDGCFADRFLLPLVNLHLIPDTLDDDHAVFVEEVAASLHAVQQLRAEGKPYITVLGDGRMGLLCAQLMNKLNASVRVVGKHEDKMELAGKWGIKHRHESEVGRRADQDIVVDCTGSPAGLELAMKLVRPRGTILLKGGVVPPEGGRPVDLSPIATHEIRVVGSRCGPFAEAVAVLARGELDVLSLISRRTKLEQAVDALRLARRPELLKVIMEV